MCVLVVHMVLACELQICALSLKRVLLLRKKEAILTGKMEGPVPSKCWSSSTLEEGIAHVDAEAQMAALDAEELKIQQELEDRIM